MRNFVIFIVFILFFRLITYASDTLMYDNGNVGYSYASGIYNWAVLFDNNRLFLPDTALVNIIDAHSSICSLKVYSDTGSFPASLLYDKSFTANNGWNKIPISNSDTMTGPFWITFYIPTTDSGPKMASDNDGGTGHSYYYASGSWLQFTTADFMIRCMGRFLPYPHDIASLKFVNPNTGNLYNNNHIIPKIEIMNAGSNSESFYAKLLVYKRTNDIYAESVFVNNMIPGESTDVVFPAIDLINGDLYKWIYVSNLGNDDFKMNDTLYLNSTTCPLPNEKRTVFMELFDASGCSFCPPSAYAMDSMAEKYGRDSLVILQYQVNNVQGDEFSEYGLDKLNNIYNQQGTPYTWFDSDTNLLGTTDVNLNFARFDSIYNMRKQIYSPAKIEFINGNITADSGHFDINITITGDISKYYDYKTMTHNLTLEYAVYENNIYDEWPNGDSVHNHIVRIADDIDMGTLSYGSGKDVSISFPVGETGGRPWENYSGDYHNVGFAVVLYNKVAIDDTLPAEVLQSKDAEGYLGLRKISVDNPVNRFKIKLINNVLQINSSYKHFDVSIFNITGSRSFNGQGCEKVILDLKSILKSRGIYFVRLKSKKDIQTRKILFIK